MKKRIVCVLLTLIMLLSLVPMGASAATNKTSEAAITVLKQMTSLKNECYHFTGTEFRTGYGTVCEEKHVFGTNGEPKENPAEYMDKDGKPAYKKAHEITEKNADLALRKALLALDEKVNGFASANRLSLTQYQHDALVVFSYDAGTGWMSGTGALKSAIINGCTATELLNAMNLWTGNASNGNTTTLSRRKVEVNMYMNGIYSNTIPSSYGYVTYKPNGGAMPQVDYNTPGQYTFYYDTNATMEHPVVPTKNGAIFLGWYADVNGADTSAAEWSPKLNHIMNTHTLTALWQYGTTLATSPVRVGYKLTASQLAERNVFNGSDGEVNETLTKKLEEDLYYYDAVAVDYDFIDAKGNRWSHMAGTDDGWLKVGAPNNNESFTDSHGTVIATATVTVNGYLNVRSDAGTDNKIIGALAKNETVDIYEIKTVNGQQWGRSKHGWLCLTYTRLILKNDVTISDAGIKAYAFTGEIKGTTPVNVHVEPGNNTNYVKYLVYPMANPEEDPVERDLRIPADTDVTMTNLFMVNGELWTKATWTQKEEKWTEVNGEKVYDFHNVTRSGWAKFDDIAMDPATFVVEASSVNVRDGWGDAAKQIFTLNKGVQVQVDEINLVNENLWGHFTVKMEDHTGEVNKSGYVNLASKYFSRVGAPSVEHNTTSTNLIATVINTDALKVRATGATYGAVIGRLTRGTTVAVWEVDDDWYKVDSNRNGTYDYKEDGWCSATYLDVREGNMNGSSTVTDANGNKYQTDGTGKGIVANTYSGVNVRSGPGTGYATNGKLLPGTVVEILETANAGKWGRVAQGWISMDYVTMVTYNEMIPESQKGGTTVDSFDKAEKTTTTAVYTGILDAGVPVYRTPEVKDSEKIRTTDTAENITIYELATVTKSVTSDEKTSGDKTTVTTVTTTTYWARINDGWVQNPETTIELNALDEKTHTQTGVSKLNVRKGTDTEAIEDGTVFDVLVQGDQVVVTALDIIKDKVWGRVDTNEGTGWIRLDYMSEGAVYVKKAPVQNTTTPSAPVLGNGSSTGGYVNNGSGYRYTGKVIRANEVNVRSQPSTTAAKTTALKNGAALVIYETTVAENMAWGRCDAGWVYLYYVDLVPVVNGAVDARVVYNENTIIYTDVNCSAVAGTYSRMSTIDIYEVVGKMARTDKGWVNTDDLL